MSQTNTNTNTNNGQNQNQNSARDRQSRDSGSRGHSSCCNDCRNNSIAKYSFEGKMKDGPISTLIITKIGHQPNYYKKIVNTLPVLCPDTNYQGLNEVVQTGNNLVEADYIPLYPDVIQ